MSHGGRGGVSVSPRDDIYMSFLYSTTWEIDIPANPIHFKHSVNQPIPSYPLWKKTARRVVSALTGLKASRVDQWLEVLEEESRTMTARTWYHLFVAGLTVAVRHPVQSAEFKRRIRICSRCPVYDKEMKRCRPYTGSPDGCGCYVPFKALDSRPCWIRELDPHRGW